MNGMDWRRMVIALAAGLGGAAVAQLLGLAAAALIGSALAVTIVALLGLKPDIPNPLRNVAFCVISVSLGSGVTPDILAEISHWPLSILLLAVTVIAVMIVCGLILRVMFGADATTAALATSPGALSYTLALAADRNADLRFVMLLQSLRLFLITVLLPPMIGFANGGVGAGPAADVPHLHIGEVAVLLAVTYGLGMILTRLRFPAPYILAGLAVSGIAHATGIVAGRPADMVLFFGFSVTGAVIGARFTGFTLAEIKRLALAGFVSTAVAVAISVAGAFAASGLLDLPFGQVWVSYAPGGVEGMTTMALALGYDPVYVATHHVFRILFLIGILPVMVGLFAAVGRKSGKT
jgi:hypothetical protein